ncbi:MAG: porin family protein, partial [Muribaculaceae bacterium]|nr:porin family protein [Muribaculaceae bacterium]
FMLLVASVSASAQWYIGGAVGVERKFDEDFTDFSILPDFGYNFNDSWALGAQVGFHHTYSEGWKTNLGVISPYARWTYFRTGNNIVSLFLDGGFGFEFGSSKYDDGPSSDTTVKYSVGISPGVSFNFTDNFSIEAHMGGLTYESGNTAAKVAKVVTPRFGLNFKTTELNLGFVYTF